MRRADFHYDLPAELIAQAPLPERAASRLLVVRGDAPFADHTVRDLPGLLAPGDLLVFNDTRVVAARLPARKPTGGKAELLLERPLEHGQALVQARSSKGFRAGDALESAGGIVRMIDRDGDLWRVQVAGDDALAFFEAHGEIPLPPYIERAADDTDRERYQSVFARDPGAVAAPTASLHFDAALLAALQARGVASSTVTLHVGAGTFQPLRVDDPDHHVMHAERYAVPQSCVEAVKAARAGGGRVVAVGTTVARTLEASASDGELRASSGDTRLFIRPGYAFRVVDALLTNFHLPESTLLMLVAALAGRERMLAAYAHAIAARYRFFSYGDAMLILPRPAGPT